MSIAFRAGSIIVDVTLLGEGAAQKISDTVVNGGFTLTFGGKLLVGRPLGYTHPERQLGKAGDSSNVANFLEEDFVDSSAHELGQPAFKLPSLQADRHLEEVLEEVLAENRVLKEKNGHLRIRVAACGRKALKRLQEENSQLHEELQARPGQRGGSDRKNPGC